MGTLEPYLLYLGQLSCLLASAFLVWKGRRGAGALMFVAFVLMFQWGYVAASMEADVSGECLASRYAYYDCLPIIQRLSAHAAQLGHLLLAVSVVLLARGHGPRGE